MKELKFNNIIKFVIASALARSNPIQQWIASSLRSRNGANRICIFLFCFFLFSCAKEKIEYEYPQDPVFARKSRAGQYFDKDLTLYGGKKDKKKEPISEQEDNKYLITTEKNKQNPLWIASLEVVGDLLPIDVVDSNSGLIVTDWYESNKNDKERTKINLLVKDKKISEENLALSIFKQKKDKNGVWQDQPASDKLAAKLIREKIIEKAKMIAGK